MAATSAHLKLPTKPIKIKRRRRRETTITTNSSAADHTSSSTAAAAHISPNQYQTHKINTPIATFSPENNRCSASPTTPPHPPPPEATGASPLPPSSSADLKIRHSPSTMGTTITASAQDSFHKFNSALTAGLLNPMSPPPPAAADKTRSSPTLFEMMANEPDCYARGTNVAENGVVSAPIQKSLKLSSNPLPQDKQAAMQQRLVELLALRSPGNHFNDVGSGDVKLTLSSKDGVSVCVSVHRQILVAHSRFFALKLNEKWVKQQRNSGPYSVEIADCDDIEVYIKTLMLMYCKDVRKKLMKEDVPRILATLKVSAAIGFDAGVLSCLEYLEAAPWTEDEEEKVASLLSELRLEGAGAAEVLKRVSLDTAPGSNNSSDNEEILLKLLHVVLEGKDEKARREMKTLVTKMLRENSSHSDLRKESLYFACDNCLKLLHAHFLEAAEGDMSNVSLIARQADNLHWLLDVLIDRQIGEDFLRTWATQFELSKAHCKVGPVHRYEVSRVTARLFVGIGKRELLASKEDRCLLLQTWLEPFYEDFGWMKRASRGLDRHLIEDGLSNTILTLPMSWQKDILMSWFDRFVNSGDDCPNLQRGFEVWWRRAFVSRNGEAARAREMLAAPEN